MSNLKCEDGSLRVDGINSNTYNLLFCDYHNLPQKDQGSYENLVVMRTVELFTKLEEKRIFTKLLKLFYKNKIIDINKITFNDETKQYEYRDNNLVINFDKISNHFEDKKLIEELTSEAREGKCHARTVELSPYIDGSKIVTGYITIGKNKVLHSVIEYEYNGETIILDWTKNLKITKKQYIKLTKFVEFSSLDGRKVIDEIDNIFSKIDISAKAYLVFRDELMRDIEKNLLIFQSMENENNKKSK